METLRKMKDLMEKMSSDTYKVIDKGNHSASIRARKYAQDIKDLIVDYRKEILAEIKKHEETRDKSHKKSRFNSYLNLTKNKPQNDTKN